VLLGRWARNSVLGKGGTPDGGREVVMEKPATDELGSKGLEAEVEVAPASRDTSDLCRTGGVDSGTGVSVGCAGVDTLDKSSLMSGSARGAIVFRCVVPSRG
jgi:hypothetical protein